MHIYNLDQWKHNHRYVIDDGRSERNTRRVILLTLSMMIIEISAGYLFGSMALLADGWHMGTHAVALGITAFAYYYARRQSDDPNYSFGTGKVGVLGGFASAVVLAIIALLTGKIFGWVWMDPAMGMVGALVITKWSHGLLIDTGKILLDRDVNHEAVDEIRARMEADSDTRVTDIHVWRVGSHHLSTIISLVTHYPKSPAYYKKLLTDFDEIVHITIEVNKFEGEPCVEVDSDLNQRRF